MNVLDLVGVQVGYRFSAFYDVIYRVKVAVAGNALGEVVVYDRHEYYVQHHPRQNYSKRPDKPGVPSIHCIEVSSGTSIEVSGPFWLHNHELTIRHPTCVV